jgi:hypothetical protein
MMNEQELNPQATPSQVYRVIDAERGIVENVTPKPVSERLSEALIPYPRNHRGRMTVDHEELAEAAPLATANFPDLLRQGLRFDAFTSYNETPTIYQQLVRTIESTKQHEEYLKDAALGMMPIVPEGAAYPEANIGLGEGVKISNYKRGMIVSVTEEMQKYDQVGKVRQLGELLGRAARLGEEQDVMNVITDANNYVRTSADNDQGNNTAATTFSAAGLIEAFNTLRTMKDRNTGVYINVMPNTLIVTPKLWWAAQQLIKSPDAVRASANNAAEVYGTGTVNSFFNVVDTIIVSPMLGSSYQWVLGERGRGLMFQRVEPIQILFQGAQASNEAYFDRDVLKYRVRNWYGVGFSDDRFWYFSSSSTAPTIS